MSTSATELALSGGPRAVQTPVPPRRRWGASELRRLTAMVEQESLFYWKGPQTQAMLADFRALYPLKHCMPCSSGTAALHIAVAALQLRPGDEVIVPAITDMGSLIGILYQQLVPVFADVLPDTYNLDPADVVRRIGPRTRAIMPVHLAGNPCDMTALMAIAGKHKLRVIEDCAQSWGAKHRGRIVGTMGDFGCYSFNDYKHLSTGDGGVVGTNDDGLGVGLSKWGDKHYDREAGGRNPVTLSPNYRITEPQSAIGAAQLERHDAIVARRRELAARLLDGLEGVPGLRLPQEAPGDTHSFWFFLPRLDLVQFTTTRDVFVKALLAEGVQCEGAYIPQPVYGYPVFRNHDFFAGTWPLREAGMTAMDYRTVRCPQAEALLADCVTVRLHDEMPDEYIDGVAAAFGKVAEYYVR